MPFVPLPSWCISLIANSTCESTALFTALYSLFFHFTLIHQGNFREDNFQKSMLLLQDEGTPAERRGRKGGIKGVSSCFKLVKMIMERNMQPVIIFSFSRHNCEAFALELSKLDFNSGTCNLAVCSTLDVACERLHMIHYCTCS